MLRSLADDRIRVRTAGSTPAFRINPEVARLLDERGLGVAVELHKPLTEEVVRASDYVMGCGDACPVLPGRRYRDWHVPDPPGQPDDIVTGIIDDIANRVTNLVEAITTRR